MRNSCSPTDGGTERHVIKEERRSRIDNDPGALLDEEVDATLWQNQPYRIPVIGWMQEIEKLNRADARAFYDRYYAPNNAVLVVAGDVTPDAVKAMADRTYGRLPVGRTAAAPPVEPEQNTNAPSPLPMRASASDFSTGGGASYIREPGEAEALLYWGAILGGGGRRVYRNWGGSSEW